MVRGGGGCGLLDCPNFSRRFYEIKLFGEGGEDVYLFYRWGNWDASRTFDAEVRRAFKGYGVLSFCKTNVENLLVKEVYICGCREAEREFYEISQVKK